MNAARLTLIGLTLITLAAALLRLPQLDNRPMHGDEAVHAVKCATLIETGTYHYDPVEFHGPTLYYATLPILIAAGVDNLRDMTAPLLRAAPALIGVLMIPLLWLLRDALGPGPTLIAAALTALSPALVYYSRDYIQETLLIAFTLAAIACFWRACQRPRPAWLILLGVSLGLMHATKETALIAFGCLLAAALLTRPHAGPAPARRLPEKPNPRRYRAPLLVLATALLTSFACYSVAFTHPGGWVDALRAIPIYLARGTGDTIHLHPWHYYFRLLIHQHHPGGPHWSEAGILALALVGAVGTLVSTPPRQRDNTTSSNAMRFRRFLTLYALLTLLIYTALPYKTPWSMLSFHHALILLAGLGGWTLIKRARPTPLRIAAIALLLAITAHLGLQAHRAAFTLAAHRRNPYAYAQPTRDVERLASWLRDLADAQPQRRATPIQVVSDNPWPLPWYLRRFENVGYYGEMPEHLVAPIIVAAAPFTDELQTRRPVDEETPRPFYGLRPGTAMQVAIEPLVWQRYRDANEPQRKNSTP